MLLNYHLFIKLNIIFGHISYSIALTESLLLLNFIWNVTVSVTTTSRSGKRTHTQIKSSALLKNVFFFFFFLLHNLLFILSTQIIRMHFFHYPTRWLFAAPVDNRDQTTLFCSFTGSRFQFLFFLFSLILDSIKPYELHNKNVLILSRKERLQFNSLNSCGSVVRALC